MQQYTIEYRVTASLDGVTPSPVFSVDPTSPDYKAPDPDSVYRFVVEDLGYIDPDFDAGGSQGDRFLRAISVTGGLPPVSPATVGVLALEETLDPGSVVLLEEVWDMAADGPFLLPRGCVFVPQGAVLGLGGVETDDGALNPIVVRLSVQVPDSTTEYAEMLQACCCERSLDDGGCTPTVVDEISPDSIETSDIPITMTIVGSGFVEGTTTVEITPPLTIDNVQVVSATEITFDIPLQGPVASVPRTVVVSNGDGCESQGSFTISQPN